MITVTWLVRAEGSVLQLLHDMSKICTPMFTEQGILITTELPKELHDEAKLLIGIQLNDTVNNFFIELGIYSKVLKRLEKAEKRIKKYGNELFRPYRTTVIDFMLSAE